MVERVDNESAAVESVSVCSMDSDILRDLHETCREENNGVDNAHNPLIRTLSVNTKLLRKRQVGAIGTSLVPSLSGSSDGAEADRVPQHLGAVPLVISLICQRCALRFLKLRDRLEPVWVAGDEASPAEQVGVLTHPVGLGKDTGILDGLFGGMTPQRVLDNVHSHGLAAAAGVADMVDLMGRFFRHFDLQLRTQLEGFSGTSEDKRTEGNSR